MSKIAVLGDGAWGTAVAMLLADNGHQVTIWCHNAHAAHAITTQSRNAVYFPDFQLNNARIRATTHIQEALSNAVYVFESIPVPFMRSVLAPIASSISPEQAWVVLSKGIEQETLLLPSQILDDICSERRRTVVLSGPSFAKDLAHKQVTGVALASHDNTAAETVYALVANRYFRPSITSDMIGVQLGGAIKNSIALGIGMLDGAGYTDNTKALFLTRGLQEMAALVCALGGLQETMYDLAGVGDLVVTAMGNLSKNVAFGRRLGSGESLDHLQKTVGTLPEGVNTTIAVAQLIRTSAVRAPLLMALHEVITAHKPVAHLIDALIGSV